MSDLLKHINEALDYIKAQKVPQPKVGIILGTGLGGLVTVYTSSVTAK